jgi:hypothetical protein
MVNEVIDARIWSGYHFRTSDEVGARVGGQVARFVVQRALRTTGALTGLPAHRDLARR